MSKRSVHILPLIIFSQFAGTSIWFAGNAILPSLVLESNLNSDSIASITSSIQLGFIMGTLIFAFFTIADRYSPSTVFLLSSILGAVLNLSIIFFPISLTTLVILRFFTGVMLAGIYPIGMKIAADHFENGLGKALGFLVGALVLGTAFPHLLQSLDSYLDWQLVVILVSSLAALGGVLVYIFIPDGPYRKPLTKFQPNVVFNLFKIKGFKFSALGYFGHMWELYAFWVFVPFILSFYKNKSNIVINLPLWSFVIISIGSIGCIAGGYLSKKVGSTKVAFYHLLISGLCILLFPLAVKLSLPFFLGFLIIWGWAVVADSPQFSTLAAHQLSSDYIGTGLTIMNSIGFALTIVSIYLLSILIQYIDLSYSILILVIGPIIGLISLSRLKGFNSI